MSGEPKQACASERERLLAQHDEVFKQQPDHGISPQQLREKVEALEKRCEEQQLVLTYLQGFTTGIGSRIDAALRRIEELERWSANYHAVAHGGVKL